MGIKCYDFLAGSENIGISYFLSRIKALAAFPMLKKDKIVGALVYYGRSLRYYRFVVWNRTDISQMVHTTTRA